MTIHIYYCYCSQASKGTEKQVGCLYIRGREMKPGTDEGVYVRIWQTRCVLSFGAILLSRGQTPPPFLSRVFEGELMSHHHTHTCTHTAPTSLFTFLGHKAEPMHRCLHFWHLTLIYVACYTISMCIRLVGYY